jgi:sulfite oxidase
MAARTGRAVEGLPWAEGTLANCAWAGARLADVLRAAGVAPASGTSMHVCFGAHATAVQEDDWFGASLPLDAALDPEGDVLLAYEVRLVRAL